MQPEILEPFVEEHPEISSDSDNSSSSESSTISTSTATSTTSAAHSSSASTETTTSDSSTTTCESAEFNDSGVIVEEIDITSDQAPDTQPLYPDSTLSVSFALAILFNWFTAFPGVSKEAFSSLLSLLHHFILPLGNNLPSTFATARGLISTLLVPVEEYDCCVNDCIIFRGANKDLIQCPECNEPRYSPGGKIPRKRFKYLPLGPRIHRLFKSADVSQLMQSHLSNDTTMKVSDIHQTDVWRKRYSAKGPFQGDARGLSLAICTDGTNPFSKERTIYSMWPIVISILNLPSHLRRKAGYLQLLGIIPGKNEPKNIDPYLEIFVEELQQLNGESVFDSFQNNYFSLKADVFLHVLDYPGQNKLFHCHGESCTYSLLIID